MTPAARQAILFRRRAAAAAAPFVPTDLGPSILAAWFSAKDTATITESGGAVSQWNDKSGNGNHIVQATGANKPTTGANTLNGFNVLTLDGGDFLNKTSSLTNVPTSSAGCTLVCLRKFTSGTAGGLLWIVTDGASNGDAATLARQGGNMGAWGNRTSTSVGIEAEYADSDNTNWHTNTGIYTTANRKIYEDGTLKDTDTNSVFVTATPTAIYLGETLTKNRGAVQLITGQIAEAFFLATTSLTHINKIEGWAMWTYGLQSQLDAGHPYKLAPP